MSGSSNTAGVRLEEILAHIKDDRLPPVEQWNPAYCGAIDMVIHPDGRWSYMGTPIGRERMVRLFSRILRKEPDGSYVLVTPVERIGITVEDAPFVAVQGERIDSDGAPALVFTTNVGDTVVAGPDHPIRVEISETGEPRPYLHVRRGLEALIVRSVFYDLVEWAEIEDGHLVLTSGSTRFDLGLAGEASP